MGIVVGILLCIVLLLFLTWRLRSRKSFPLRPIPAFKTLQGLVGRMAESAKVVHLGLGTSSVHTDQAAMTVTGLTMLRYLAEQGVAFGVSPMTTVADPVTLLAAQDVLYRAYQQKGGAAGYRSTDVQLIAPDATAYAVGAQSAVEQKRVAANVMIGHFDQEYLLLGEPGAQRGIVQMVGSDTVSAQPFMQATSEHALLGEQVFATGAYLTKRPIHIASLCVQDIARILIVLFVIAAVVIKTLIGS